jgi:hypothetical protein
MLQSHQSSIKTPIPPPERQTEDLEQQWISGDLPERAKPTLSHVLHDAAALGAALTLYARDYIRDLLTPPRVEPRSREDRCAGPESSLRAVAGLVVGIARDDDELERTERELESALRQGNVPTGVIVLSQDFALQKLGPVPDEWIQKGITMHRSTDEDVDKGAQAFIDEYLALREFVARHSSIGQAAHASSTNGHPALDQQAGG